MKSLRFGIGIVILVITWSLKAANKDSLQVEELKKEAFAKMYSEPEIAKELILQGLKKSREIGSCYQEAACYNQLGIYYDVTSRYDSAIYCYRKTVDLAERCDQEVMKGQALNNLGLIYWNMGELDKAVQFYTLSLRIFEKHGKEKGVANTLSNIGVVYNDMEEPRKSIPFQKRALGLRHKINDPYGVSVSYANLGKAYINLHELDSARMFIQKSIVLKDSLNDQYGQAINYNNLGVILKLQSKPDSAIMAVQRSKKIRQELGEKNNLATDYFTLGGLYMDMGQYDKAYLMLDSAEDLSKDLDAKTILLHVYGRLAQLDTLSGNYKDAAKHLALRIHYQGELFDIEKNKVINEIQARYETEKKEHQLAESRVIIAEEQLKVKNRTTWAIILVALLALLIISGIYIYRQQKLKQQKLKEEGRLREELASAEVKVRIQDERVRISRDLHDHIGSQLTIISSAVDNLAYTEKDEHRKKMLYEIADSGRDTMLQLRETIWAMNQQAIDLETLTAKTREFVSHLKLDQRSIDVQLQADDNLNLSPVLAINLYRIVQEAVNNAVKYADFEHMNISFTKRNGHLMVEVSDDGKGFILNETTEKGFGLANMKERAKEFDGQLNVKSTSGEGTVVKVMVPLNQANYV